MYLQCDGKFLKIKIAISKKTFSLATFTICFICSMLVVFIIQLCSSPYNYKITHNAIVIVSCTAIFWFFLPAVWLAMNRFGFTQLVVGPEKWQLSTWLLGYTCHKEGRTEDFIELRIVSFKEYLPSSEKQPAAADIIMFKTATESFWWDPSNELSSEERLQLVNEVNNFIKQMKKYISVCTNHNMGTQQSQRYHDNAEAEAEAKAEAQAEAEVEAEAEADDFSGIMNLMEYIGPMGPPVFITRTTNGNRLIVAEGTRGRDQIVLIPGVIGPLILITLAWTTTVLVVYDTYASAVALSGLLGLSLYLSLIFLRVKFYSLVIEDHKRWQLSHHYSFFTPPNIRDYGLMPISQQNCELIKCSLAVDSVSEDGISTYGAFLITTDFGKFELCSFLISDFGMSDCLAAIWLSKEINKYIESIKQLSELSTVTSSPEPPPQVQPPFLSCLHNNPLYDEEMAAKQTRPQDNTITIMGP